MPVDLDEPTMQQIADVSGGAYFRATDNESLAAIYKKIDQLEKTKLSTRNYHTTLRGVLHLRPRRSLPPSLRVSPALDDPTHQSVRR